MNPKVAELERELERELPGMLAGFRATSIDLEVAVRRVASGILPEDVCEQPSGGYIMSLAGTLQHILRLISKRVRPTRFVSGPRLSALRFGRCAGNEP